MSQPRVTKSQIFYILKQFTNLSLPPYSQSHCLTPEVISKVILIAWSLFLHRQNQNTLFTMLLLLKLFKMFIQSDFSPKELSLALSCLQEKLLSLLCNQDLTKLSPVTFLASPTSTLQYTLWAPGICHLPLYLLFSASPHLHLCEISNIPQRPNEMSTHFPGWINFIHSASLQSST